MNWFKNIFAQFTEDNTQNMGVTNVVVAPYEPLVQEVVDDLNASNPGILQNVNQVIVKTDINSFGLVSSENPADVVVNFTRIKSEVDSQFGAGSDENSPMYLEALKRAILETIIHEASHVSDAVSAQEKSEAPLSGEELFPGGESVAERETSSFISGL